MMRRVPLLLLLVLGCGESLADVTAVEIVVTSDTPLDQIEFLGSVDGAEAFVPVTRPESARELDMTESIVVVLPDALAGQRLVAIAHGLRDGVRVGSGAADGVVVARDILRLEITLGAAQECGDGIVTGLIEGCDDGNLDPDDGCAADCRVEDDWTCTHEGEGPSLCVEGCGATSCPAGCCTAGVCQPFSLESCGAPGTVCAPCDPLTANRCVNGECQCGDGMSCAPGQRCVAGLCVCDEISCPEGCCAGAQCQTRAADTCGDAGGTCVECSMVTANACSSSGTCQCGAGPPCALGQRCSGGTCACDPSSCPDGCCDGEQCVVSSLAACGMGGNACTACDLLTADSCDASGNCRCGTGAPCADGQRCDGGSCICDGLSCAGCCQGSVCRPGTARRLCGSGGGACDDCGAETCDGGICSGCNPASCPSGCCSGSTCSPASIDTCGTAASACVACDPMVADGCSAGSCSCGGGPACGAGQRCAGGTCVCDDVSCPDGCCDGTTCNAADADSCGIAGSTCVACDPQDADRCAPDGTCACGGQPPCGPGQRCVGGACMCDSTSCPLGCCVGSTCSMPGLATCGMGGATCTSCDPSKSDQCTGGSCACGSGPPCDPGQHCLGGACVCDGSSCAGCCEGNVCQPGTDAATCGVGGSACEACPGAAVCLGGICASCDSTSCDGCCAGATCVDPVTTEQCGDSGDACFACDPVRTDRCGFLFGFGGCRCGGGPQCDPGQHCVDGRCECDGVSCPSGCCDGDRCRSRTVDDCGIGGESCMDCSNSRSDGCSPSGECTCGGGPVCTGDDICDGGSCIPD